MEPASINSVWPLPHSVIEIKANDHQEWLREEDDKGNRKYLYIRECPAEGCTEKNWKFGCWTYNGEEGNHPQHLRNHPQHKDNHSTEHALFEAFNSATVLVGRRNGSNRSRRRNGLNRRRRLDKVHAKNSPARATSSRTPAPPLHSPPRALLRSRSPLWAWPPWATERVRRVRRRVQEQGKRQGVLQGWARRRMRTQMPRDVTSPFWVCRRPPLQPC